MTTWPQLLDAMERSLDHYEAALDAETISPDPHWPRVGRPAEPIPSELLARAAELMARNNRITAEIQRRLKDRPKPPRRDGYSRNQSAVSVLDTSA
ncbi:MAG: hypothetical protein OES24_20420 [Acidimicrobiia bacterium]|nr:hypothetical protein [Acidimicrobiia bacterium]